MKKADVEQRYDHGRWHPTINVMRLDQLTRMWCALAGIPFPGEPPPAEQGRPQGSAL